MKKLLILILIGLLVTLSIFIIFKGLEIGSVEILGITGIKEKNDALDEKIQEASKLAQKDYKQSVETVQESAKMLEKERKSYEELTEVSSEDGSLITNQIERYEIETLWVKLGNYATSEGAIMKMEVIKGSTNTQDTYNLKFSVTGSYISITDFISDIENDSSLAFKIEEFKLIPSSSENDLEATFVCKDIGIKDVSAQTSTPTTPTTTGEDANTVNQTNTSQNINATNTTSGNTTQ